MPTEWSVTSPRSAMRFRVTPRRRTGDNGAMTTKFAATCDRKGPWPSPPRSPCRAPGRDLRRRRWPARRRRVYSPSSAVRVDAPPAGAAVAGTADAVAGRTTGRATASRGVCVPVRWSCPSRVKRPASADRPAVLHARRCPATSGTQRTRIDQSQSGERDRLHMGCRRRALGLRGDPDRAAGCAD